MLEDLEDDGQDECDLAGELRAFIKDAEPWMDWEKDHKAK